MQQALADYLLYLAEEKNSSAHTVKSYRKDLTHAVGFFREKSGADLRPERVSPRLLRSFLASMHEPGYARTTIARRVAAVRSWFRFPCRRGVLTTNPADGL